MHVTNPHLHLNMLEILQVVQRVPLVSIIPRSIEDLYCLLLKIMLPFWARLIVAPPARGRYKVTLSVFLNSGGSCWFFVQEIYKLYLPRSLWYSRNSHWNNSLELSFQQLLCRFVERLPLLQQNDKYAPLYSLPYLGLFMLSLNLKYPSVLILWCYSYRTGSPLLYNFIYTLHFYIIWTI